MALYVAIGDRLRCIDDIGSGPAVTDRLAGHEPECLAVHPDRPRRVFCGTFQSGLYRSTDGGDAWTRVGADVIDPGEEQELTTRRGVEDVSVMAVAIDPTDPDVIWAGTEPSALFRSTDGGDSWERIGGLTDVPSERQWAFPPRPYTHHVRWIEVDPTDPDRVYVGIEAGALLVTPDGGESWIERPEGSRRDNHTLATHPDAPGRVYSAAGDGYAESDDYGETWQHPQAGLEHRYVWGLAVDPGDPDTVLVSAARGAGAAHGHGEPEAYLYRRVGDAWNRIDGAVPTGPGALRAALVAGQEAGHIIAANNHGIYRSEDGGRSWTAVDIPWPTADRDRTVRALAVL